MTGQAKVQQDRATVGREQHIGWLEVEVANILFVQAVQGHGDGCADARDLQRRRPRAGLGLLVQPLLQAQAGDVFHHQIRHSRQVARSHQPRHRVPLQGLHDLVLHLKADDVLGAITRGHARHLHHHGEGRWGTLRKFHRVHMGHAPGMQAFANEKAIELGARRHALHCPVSNRLAKASGKPASRIARAAAVWL